MDFALFRLFRAILRDLKNRSEQHRNRANLLKKTDNLKTIKQKNVTVTPTIGKNYEQPWVLKGDNGNTLK
jgi:hypothetical protein